jgi:hypothetical protein
MGSMYRTPRKSFFFRGRYTYSRRFRSQRGNVPRSFVVLSQVNVSVEDTWIRLLRTWISIGTENIWSASLETQDSLTFGSGKWSSISEIGVKVSL